MKNPVILFLLLIVTIKMSGQMPIYDPFLSASSANFVLPKSPWGPVGTMGTVTFTIGNNGPEAMNKWDSCGGGEGCKLIIQISPNTAYTIIGSDINSGAIPTGTIATKFSWFYDSFDGTLRGTQIATIASGESGTITFPIKHVAISTEASQSPCDGQQNCYGTQVTGSFRGLNGLVVNLLPPSQPTNNNEPTTNNNLGGYEYTFTRLPLQNLTFQAKPLSDRKVELNWTTLTEQNNREFEVERFDAATKTWSMIGKKEAAGFSTKKSEYVYIDQISELKVSKVYYRLKSIEFNGAFQYTDVRMVSFNGPHGITMNTFPNPFTQAFYLNLNIKEEGPVDIQIFDVLGRQVFKESNIIQKGYSSKLIQLDKVPQGTYSVHVSYDGIQQVLKTLKIN
ncbi:MAG: T9SS type A sorting domain-containing protein [Saprospiraceae bacterium]|nr:T9SS type A sorting domain-containing protein [Saprospiraceae bacterium]